MAVGKQVVQVQGREGRDRLISWEGLNSKQGQCPEIPGLSQECPQPSWTEPHLATRDPVVPGSLSPHCFSRGSTHMSYTEIMT